MVDSEETPFTAMRREMLDQVVQHANLVCDKTGRAYLADRVLQVIGEVPRHVFVPAELQALAYLDSPLPIGYGKTISQPFMVALMTDLLDPEPEDRVLEIGTGLGYQAAVLSELVTKVYSVEIIEELANEAVKRLADLGCSNIETRLGDGGQGWAEHAPFDKIMVTAAPELLPPSLLTQLKPGGRMVIPAGLQDSQQLMLIEKDEAGKTTTAEILPVRFSTLVTSH